MTLDSRAASNVGDLATVPYTVSAPPDLTWGQPSIIHLVRITPLANIIAGHYAASHSSMLDSDLDLEFQAWEAASDQDYFDFESHLTDAAG
ncbi:MAG TPA: hypothetical protein VJL34_11275 [Anaerolineales bacterium]|nr:hypothetical protein [Anaerolineales bacterium]